MTVWSRNIWNLHWPPVWRQCMSDDGRYEMSSIEAFALLAKLSALNPGWTYELRGE